MSLLEQQRVFWQSVRTRPGPPELAEVFVGDGRLSAHQRLELYRTAYWVRQVQALRELFPSVTNRVGDAHFAQLASRFLRDAPSSSWALEHLGPPFVAWLRGQADTALTGAVAALDQARAEVFTAPDPTCWRREALRGFPLEELAVRVGPHVAWCRVPAAALVAGAPGPANAATGAEVVFCAWREGFAVLQALLPPEEAGALALAAREAVPFPTWCQLVAGDAAGPHVVLATFERWLSRGWLVTP